MLEEVAEPHGAAALVAYAVVECLLARLLVDDVAQVAEDFELNLLAHLVSGRVDTAPAYRPVRLDHLQIERWMLKKPQPQASGQARNTKAGPWKGQRVGA